MIRKDIKKVLERTNDLKKISADLVSERQAFNPVTLRPGPVIFRQPPATPVLNPAAIFIPTFLGNYKTVDYVFKFHFSRPGSRFGVAAITTSLWTEWDL